MPSDPIVPSISKLGFDLTSNVMSERVKVLSQGRLPCCFSEHFPTHFTSKHGFLPLTSILSSSLLLYPSPSSSTFPNSAPIACKGLRKCVSPSKPNGRCLKHQEKQSFVSPNSRGKKNPSKVTRFVNKHKGYIHIYQCDLEQSMI